MLVAPTAPVIRDVSSIDFCTFTNAWRSYQAFRQKVGIAKEEETKELLDRTSRTIEGLTARNRRFPFSHKLSALIYREQRKPEDALNAIVRYRELIAIYSIPDAEAERLEANLKSAVEAARSPPQTASSAEELGLRRRMR